MADNGNWDIANNALLRHATEGEIDYIIQEVRRTGNISQRVASLQLKRHWRTWKDKEEDESLFSEMV